MKKTLTSLILLLAICLNSKATNYYIAASGNDANNGTSTSTPWKTLSKLNSFFSSLKAGDNVYLNRGDVFYGSIVINKSGASGSPITISAYGSGAQPVITGLTTVSSWTNLGNNIWESTAAISTLSSCNMVLVNGVNIAMGRYPNTGYLAYQSGGSNTSLTSSLLTSTNWTGAEAVVRKNDWVLDRCKITNYSGTTLTYSDPYTNDVTIANYGFFIQNDSRTLDAQNEWYYNPSTKKIRIYSTSTPANVQVATQANLLSDNGFDYITVDNIAFIGSSNDAVYLYSSSDYWHLQNCSVSFCGQNGIYLVAGNNSVLDNNLINNCNRAGIENDGGTGNTISNNRIANIGVVKGQSFDASHNDGIYASSSNVVIKYNTISNVSYNGIFISYAVGTGTVQYNFVDSTNMVLDDGGGIYTAGTELSVRTIDHNIVLNTMGNREGTNNLARVLASGIYLDEPSSNVTVTNNTVANSLNCGIKMHRANSSIVQNNTVFNNTTWQIYFQNATSTTAIYKNVMKNNIFFSKASSQWTLGFVSITNDIPSFGTADSNYYARPTDDNITLSTYQTNTNYVNRTLASWQSFTGQDAHSHKSPKTITNVSDLRFEYNPTSSNKTISLDANYIDVRNVSYNGSITLAPYTSAVLIKNGATTTNQSPTANAGPDQTITLPTNSVTLSGSGTDPNGTISSYSWNKISGPSSFAISSNISAVTNVTGLVQGIYLFQLKITDNNGATGLDTVQITVNAAGSNSLIANADSDQSITLPTSVVTLSGSGTDTKGTISSYNWTKISGPSSFAISNNATAVTNVTGLVQGIYLFQLKLTDNKGVTDLDTVQITVNAAGTTLLAAVSLSNPVNGLNYQYYEGGFSVIPTFLTLTPVKTGTSANFDISLANRTTFFSFNFSGYINVPADGQYTFYTTSDDGSNLYIDNILVVNNDGLHNAIEKSGTIGLAAGKHAISVGYIQSGVNKSLSVSYAAQGISKQVIPSSSLYISSTSGSNIIGLDNNSNQITSSTQINLQVYPNPFVNNINVNIGSETSGIYKLVLIDAIGRVILTTTRNKPPGTFQQSINTSSLEKGIYFLKVIQNDKESVVKLIK